MIKTLHPGGAGGPFASSDLKHKDVRKNCKPSKKKGRGKCNRGGTGHWDSKCRAQKERNMTLSGTHLKAKKS